MGPISVHNHFECQMMNGEFRNPIFGKENLILSIDLCPVLCQVYCLLFGFGLNYIHLANLMLVCIAELDLLW